AGQSALESAALLHEQGAQVEVLVREKQVRWLKTRRWVEWLMDARFYPFKAPGKIGPLGINWLIEHPRLFTSFPRRVENWMAYRSIRAAGSGWLKPRVDPVTVRTGHEVAAAEARGDAVRLRLKDGNEREVDHALLATGYRVNISLYNFLQPELLQSVRTANGYPVLNGGFEASVPGLYFVGAPAAYSF